MILILCGVDWSYQLRGSVLMRGFSMDVKYRHVKCKSKHERLNVALHSSSIFFVTN